MMFVMFVFFFCSFDFPVYFLCFLLLLCYVLFFVAIYLMFPIVFVYFFYLFKEKTENIKRDIQKPMIFVLFDRFRDFPVDFLHIS